MEAKDVNLLSALLMISETFGIRIVPCDLTRPAVSSLPSGEVFLFLPRSPLANLNDVVGRVAPVDIADAGAAAANAGPSV